MNKPKSFIIFIIAIVVVLSVIQVVVSNSLSTTGIELAKIQKEQEAYDKKNSLLREKLLLASSYTQISSRAGTLGFVEEKSRYFVSAPLPIASNNDRQN